MKRKVIEAIIEKLKQDLATALEAGRTARAAATSSEAKAENQYDTRGLEASYLADGQMKRAAELEQQLAMYHMMLDANIAPSSEVKLGSLVELETNGRRSLYFLMKEAGGITVTIEGRSVNVITPHSPLGDALLGHTAGDVVEVDAQNVTREYEVLNVF